MKKPYITHNEFKNRLFKECPWVEELYEKEHLKYMISQEIKNIRAKRKYSQLELAKKAGTTQSVIARIESWNANISLTTLSKILVWLDAKIKLEMC